MPTERLYYQDSYLTDFTARVKAVHPARERGEVEVVLDRTAFYPEGGGQPSDLGRLGGAPVVAVVDREGEVVHLVRGQLPEGEVRGEVEWSRRFDHMQQHTGQHILSQAFSRLLGAETVSFHMGAEVSTIDLAVPSLSAGAALRGRGCRQPGGLREQSYRGPPVGPIGSRPVQSSKGHRADRADQGRGGAGVRFDSLWRHPLQERG